MRQEGIDKDIECCYSCSNGKYSKAECNCQYLKNRISIKESLVHKCEKYEKMEMQLCLECNKYFRAIGNHMRAHNLTIDEYRKKYKIKKSKPKETWGIPKNEYRECCYNCGHAKLEKKKIARCDIDDKTIHGKKILFFKCKNYKEITLVQCEECGYFLRSLGNHVQIHNLTAAKYKEKYGYNRTTSLSCKLTSSLIGESAKDQVPNLLEHHSSKLGIKCGKNKGCKIRQEGLNKMIGRKLSDEHKKKISEHRKGKPINKGHLTEEHKANLCKAQQERLKNIKRDIVRDELGRIVTYTEKYKYWEQYNRIHKNYMGGIKMTPQQMRERKMNDVK